MKSLGFYAAFFVISVLIVAAAIVEKSRLLLLLGMVLVGLTSYFYLIEKRKGGGRVMGMMKKLLILASLSAGYLGLVSDALRYYAQGIHSPAIYMWVLGIALYIVGVIMLVRLKEKGGE